MRKVGKMMIIGAALKALADTERAVVIAGHEHEFHSIGHTSEKMPVQHTIGGPEPFKITANPRFKAPKYYPKQGSKYHK